jgi:hypothetical protein
MSIEKCNNDISIFKHLLGESFVSSMILYLDYHPTHPYLEIQCLNFMINIYYKNDTGKIYIIRISKERGFIIHFIWSRYLNYSISLTIIKGGLNGTCMNRYTCKSKNEFNNAIHNIKNDDNDLNEIHYYLKSIDKDFIHKYMIIIEYCFDLMGG